MSTATTAPERTATPRTTIHCHECDLEHEKMPLERGRKASCIRCGAKLFESDSYDTDLPFALAIAGLIFFACANFYPVLSFSMEGRVQTNHLMSGVIEFWSAGYHSLSVVVFLASIALPLLSLGCFVYLLGGMRSGTMPPGAPRVMRFLMALRPWAMTDVYLLGVFVAFVKLSDFADIGLEPGFFTFIGLILATAAAHSSFHVEAFWHKMPLTDKTEGPVIGHCHQCHHDIHAGDGSGEDIRCPRCLTKYHVRKPDSINRAWAFLIAATICYIPANVFPIMTVISFGRGQPDTILSGVIHLVEANQWSIAAIVFFASIFVPMLKIFILAFLLLSVQFSRQANPRQRTQAYRITEFIGRWSMIDIFMISILVGLVKLDAIATIEAEPGAVAFAAVVILTMLSAMCFDPRLIWDRIEDNNERG